ncbi:LysR family transcriptional regulator [Pseudooceanicola aestuarii]|uniref:LysR family transcriptional regulator n=1 Tax=Pseudooceanicola aestuarii TaxID=2697319 RepID=UPI0013D1026D|nr:LysR family transcriptional regulator [Pseudooceanicola aestuarii]
MKNWDDLRYLVAVHKTGSMSSAARLLDTNPATVSRRLARLSETLGFELFLKTPSGWVANDAVGELIDSITTFENDLESYLNAKDTTATETRGHVTIGTPPTVAAMVLLPGLRDFIEKYPELELTFNTLLYQEALGETDLFLTPVRPEQGRLVVRYVGKVSTNVYGFEDSPRDGRWVGLLRVHEKFAPMQHARAIMGGADPDIRMETMLDVCRAVTRTRLPGVMTLSAARSIEGLQVFDPEAKPNTSPLYLCFHETRRKDPVLQTVADWASECVGLQEAT